MLKLNQYRRFEFILEESIMMNLFPISVALILILGLLGQQQQVAEAAATETCHLREFDLCMTSAIVFVQGPAGTKLNDAEIEKQCNLFKDTEECLTSFTDRCMTPTQNSLVDFTSGGILGYMRDYCKKGSELRAKYLKHGDCVMKQRKSANKCLIDFQAAVERSTSDDTNWKDRPKVLCW